MGNRVEPEKVEYTIWDICPYIDSYCADVEINLEKPVDGSTVYDILMDFGSCPPGLTVDEYRALCRKLAQGYA